MCYLYSNEMLFIEPGMINIIMDSNILVLINKRSLRAPSVTIFMNIFYTVNIQIPTCTTENPDQVEYLTPNPKINLLNYPTPTPNINPKPNPN